SESGGSCALSSYWDEHQEARAFFRRLTHFDPPAVLLNDTTRNWQAQPCALPGIFGREEWLEDPVECFWFDARSRVAHLDANKAVFPCVGEVRAIVEGCRELQCS